uniref:Uncharacterized protein n=1 Tax=Panagrolaimus davidi TaxID=227884 RepID=A0A914PEG9_9BILA
MLQLNQHFSKHKISDSISSDTKFNTLNLNQNCKVNPLLQQVVKNGVQVCEKNNDYFNCIDDEKTKKSIDTKKNGFGQKLSNDLNISDWIDERKRLKKAENSSKTSSTISLRIIAYENSLPNLCHQETKSSLLKKLNVKTFLNGSASIGNSFEFIRQQENEPSEPEIAQFKASQILLGANDYPSPSLSSSSVFPSSSSSLPSSSDASPTVSQSEAEHKNGGEVSDGNSGLNYACSESEEPGVFGGFFIEALAMKENTIAPTPGIFNTDILPFSSKKPFAEPVVEKNETNFDLSKFANIQSFLSNASAAQIFCMYKNFLETLPVHLRVAPLAELLVKPCCTECCFLKFTAECIMRERIKIPADCATKQSVFYAILQYHFYLIQRYYFDGKFVLEIIRIPVCSTFFCQVHMICKNRFDNLCHQIVMGFKQAVPHGNAPVGFERPDTLQKLAKLVNSLHHTAEPHPSGGYTGASLTSKVNIMKDAGVYKAGSTSHLFKKLEQTVHVQKQNTFTKCSSCINIRLLTESDRLSFQERQEAKQHLANHLQNVKDDRRDYAIRVELSVTTHEIMSIGFDGCSKELNKYPSTKENRSKTLNDALKPMCSLNAAIIHKKCN